MALIDLGQMPYKTRGVIDFSPFPMHQGEMLLLKITLIPEMFCEGHGELKILMKRIFIFTM